MKYFAVIFLAFVSIASLTSQNDISLRIAPEAYTIEGNKTKVAIQVKVDDAELELADQCYRFYYDAVNTELNDSNIHIKLPGELYYDAQVVDHINRFDASTISALEYDKNLGFTLVK